MLAPETRGWCPGALRPMASGDGLVVRVRPRAGTLGVDALATCADVALGCGNGHLDLTRRANLQIRGVTPESHESALRVLSDAGLLDASAAAEAVRNVLVDPLAGLGRDASADVRAIARDLEAILATDARLHALPAKFGFSVSAGGETGVAREVADIGVVTRQAVGDALVVLRVRDGDWIVGTGAVGDAAAAAADVARVVLGLLGGDRRRVRDLEASLIKAHWPAAAPFSEGCHETTHAALGPIEMADGPVAVGLAAPFGRVEARPLGAFARALAGFGVGEVRMSPWRSIYVPVEDLRQADAVVAAGRAAGFVTDPSDPVLRVDACPGAPACESATVETRSVARSLAGWLDRLGVETLHVSGCAKGCARSRPADIVLVGDNGRFRIVRGGTARDGGDGEFAPDVIGALDLIAAGMEGRHG